MVRTGGKPSFAAIASVQSVKYGSGQPDQNLGGVRIFNTIEGVRTFGMIAIVLLADFEGRLEKARGFNFQMVKP